jgi:hypothetical protein
MIGVDATGTLPTTKNGNRYFLLAIDLFTKSVVTKAVSDITAETAAKFIAGEVASHHSIPNKLITDQGSAFDSDIMKQTLAVLDVEHRMSPAYYHDPNGGSERAIKTIKEILARYCWRQRDEWDETLIFITNADNSTYHATTGFSPFFLEHGRDPKLPLANIVLSKVNEGSSNAIPVDLTEFSTELINRLSEAFETVKVNIAERGHKALDHTNRRAKDSKISVGCAVWLWKPRVGSGAKLMPSWHGPYRAIAFNANSNTYTLAGRKGRYKAFPVHVSRLKRFLDPAERPTEEPQEVDPATPEADEAFDIEPSTSQSRTHKTYTVTTPEEAEPEEYEVEKIIDRQQRSKGLFYRVRWKGYDKTFDEWIPAQNCNCPELIREYEKVHGPVEPAETPPPRKRSRKSRK